MTALARRTPSLRPFFGLTPWFDDVERLFDTASEWPASSLPMPDLLTSQVWRPACDIRETDEAFLVSVEIPGIAKEDVEISLEGNMLTISGERRFTDEVDRNDFHRIERRYGAFARSFTLPKEIDGDAVEARYDSGVLTVTVPKSATAKPRRIEVH